MAHHADLYSRWSREARELFRPGERVGVAVSGGPDSVLLLEFMQQLARETGLVVALVHFNHHLRGAESDADEKFVRDLAEARGLEFFSAGADVAHLARERRGNVEATARDLRYQFFFSLVNQGKLQKVATAHTVNDQAETVLLKILRGTGTRGLSGISPTHEGKVVRPFLSLRRAEIEAEIEKRKLAFRIDPSNRDPRLRRNKIRLELLPLLEREFNPEIVLLLKELAERARQDEAFLEQQARDQARAWRVREGNQERIPVRPLLDFPPAIGRRVLRQMIQAARGSLAGITHRHIEALRHLAAEGQSGRTLALPGGLVARREFDWLAITAGGPPRSESKPANFSFPVAVPGAVRVPQLGVTFRFKIVGPEELRKAYNNDVAGLDPSRLSGRLRLRNWRAGDCFQPAGRRKPSKLKELFQRQKIPVARRKLWPVLESGKEIVWVRGFPPAYPASALPDSNTLLIVEEGDLSPN